MAVEPIRITFNFPLNLSGHYFMLPLQGGCCKAAVVKMPVLVMAVLLAVKLKRVGLVDF